MLTLSAGGRALAGVHPVPAGTLPFGGVEATDVRITPRRAPAGA